MSKRLEAPLKAFAASVTDASDEISHRMKVILTSGAIALTF